MAQTPTISYQIDTDEAVNITFYPDVTEQAPGAEGVNLDNTLASVSVPLDPALVYEDSWYDIYADTSSMSPEIREAISRGAKEAIEAYPIAVAPTISYQITTDPTDTPAVNPEGGLPGGTVTIDFYRDFRGESCGVDLDSTLASVVLPIKGGMVYDDRFFGINEDTSWMSAEVRTAIAQGAETARQAFPEASLTAV